jgi:hypothetical protein
VELEWTRVRRTRGTGRQTSKSFIGIERGALLPRHVAAYAIWTDWEVMDEGDVLDNRKLPIMMAGQQRSQQIGKRAGIIIAR